MKTVQIQSGEVSAVKQTGDKITKSMYYEQGTEGSEILFTLICNKLPVGSVVSFHCPDAGPNPPINLPDTVVSASPSFVTGMKTEVPPNFAGTIYYSVTLTQAPPPDANMYLQASIPAEGTGGFRYDPK
jgi:hypothetical protein